MTKIPPNGPCKRARGVVWLYQHANTFMKVLATWYNCTTPPNLVVGIICRHSGYRDSILQPDVNWRKNRQVPYSTNSLRAICKTFRMHVNDHHIHAHFALTEKSESKSFMYQRGLGTRFFSKASESFPTPRKQLLPDSKHIWIVGILWVSDYTGKNYFEHCIWWIYTF